MFESVSLSQILAVCVVLLPTAAFATIGIASHWRQSEMVPLIKGWIFWGCAIVTVAWFFRGLFTVFSEDSPDSMGIAVVGPLEMSFTANFSADSPWENLALAFEIIVLSYAFVIILAYAIAGTVKTFATAYYAVKRTFNT